MAALAHNASCLCVERTFLVVDEMNQEEYEEAMKELIENKVALLGDLNKIFFGVDANWREIFLAEFDERIHRPSVRTDVAG